MLRASLYSKLNSKPQTLLHLVLSQSACALIEGRELVLMLWYECYPVKHQCLRLEQVD